MNGQQKDFVITLRDMESFRRLIEHETVKEFFEWDRCSMVADKYLIAMALTYFKRGNLSSKQFTPLNFFVALYLAHDMEEDDLDLKNDLIWFAVGEDITKVKVMFFMEKRDKLLHSLNFRAAVNRLCCEELMKYCLPYHSVWKRTRAIDHGGVNIPFYVKEAVHKELCLTHRFSYSVSKVRCIVCEVKTYLYKQHLLAAQRAASLHNHFERCNALHSATTTATRTTHSSNPYKRLQSFSQLMPVPKVQHIKGQSTQINPYSFRSADVYIFEE